MRAAAFLAACTCCSIASLSSSPLLLHPDAAFDATLAGDGAALVDAAGLGGAFVDEDDDARRDGWT